MKGIRRRPGGAHGAGPGRGALGELDRETQAFGLATPGGIVTHTGCAGLTLGGGIGWLQRKYGLTIDQLSSVDLVTADGELVKASATENADLFWGVRGGGGNFGIVTEFEFRLNPVGPIVLAGPIFWPMEESPRVLRFYREWIADAPDELMTIVVHRKAPPLPFVPRGAPRAGPSSAWSAATPGRSTRAEARRARRSRTFGLTGARPVRPKPFVDHQAMFDPSFPHGWWYYFRSCDVAELTDEVIDITVEHARRIRSPLTAFPIWQLGGAVARVGDDETAFNGRSAGHTFNITGRRRRPKASTRSGNGSAASGRHSSPTTPASTSTSSWTRAQERIREAYGPAKYDRLQDAEAQVRPRQLLPPQPEHPAGQPSLTRPRSREPVQAAARRATLSRRRAAGRSGPRRRPRRAPRGR